MPTSPATDPAGGTAVLLLFAGADGTAEGWLRLEGGNVALRGGADAPLPAAPARAVLAVPGDQVAVHWLALEEGLAPAQAAAAARLMLADASAEPLSGMHVAVGRPERGLTPAALVPNARMSEWLAAAAAAGLDPDAIVPAPLLLAPPEAGFARRDLGALSDYRGSAAAFSLEPELAEPLVAAAPVDAVDKARFEAGLGPLLADPPLDLRQGPFARRRQWRMEGQGLRRMAMLAVALAALTLAVQIAAILSYTFAADRLRAEADSLAARSAGSGADSRPAFGAMAAILFDAVRATPNVEIARIEYRPDGGLAATVTMDGPATFAALQSRIEASGLRVEAGERNSTGGRASAELTVRPA